MRAAWIEVDLGAYRRNLRALMEHVERPALAVVKANGYGHGMSLVARAALEAGCAGVAVALPEEGTELRAAGQPGRILVMGLSLEEQADLLAEHDLEPVVTREEMARALSRAGRERGKPVEIHVKVDTGMTRAGIEPEQALTFCRRVMDDPHLRLAGVMTHFASAEDEDPSSAEAQWRRFGPLVEEIGGQWSVVSGQRSAVGSQQSAVSSQPSAGRHSPQDWGAGGADPNAHHPVFHAANSAAALWFPPARLDWVRGGLLTYGVPPAPRALPFPVEPVASVYARVVQVREVPAGREVSYGGTWTAPRPSRLALVPMGYGDGLPWALSNRGHALLRGRRVPIRGRVCMDQVILDVTDLPPVEPGEVAVFVGKQGAEEITVPEIADQAGTIPYEILTRLAARLPRVSTG